MSAIPGPDELLLQLDVRNAILSGTSLSLSLRHTTQSALQVSNGPEVSNQVLNTSDHTGGLWQDPQARSMKLNNFASLILSQQSDTKPFLLKRRRHTSGSNLIRLESYRLYPHQIAPQTQPQLCLEGPRL